MTYTPRPDTARDRLERLERKVRELSTSQGLRSSSIGSGGITVRDGGGITIADQGTLLLDDGGVLIAEHLNGNRAFYVGPFNDPANYGMLVESPDGWGMIRYYSLAGDDFVYLGHEVGRPQITGWGEQVYFDAGTSMFLFAADGMQFRLDEANEFTFYHRTDRRTMAIGTDTVANGSTDIVGGSNAAGALYTRIKLQGEFAGPRVDIRNGADTDHVPIRASAFSQQPSSQELKEDLGLMDDGALNVVESLTLHRWKYLNAPASTGDEDEVVAGDNPERIGPFAEEVTPDMGISDHPDPKERAIHIDGSLWTLWKAVQELSAKVDEQHQTIQSLTDQLSALGGESAEGE